MSKVKITVYIVSYNYGRYLSQAIESVLKQTFNDYEILIFDDGSSDNTQQVIDLYRHDERVRVFNTPNIGLLKICNLALKEAKGDFLIRLDGDDYFDENILSVLYTNINKKNNTSIAVPDYYLVNDKDEILSYKRVDNFSSHNFIEVPPNGACSLIRVSVLKKIGGYSEELLAQDGFDLWIKTKKISYIANVHLPLFYYRRHENNLTNKYSRVLTARQMIKDNSLKKSISSPVIALIPTRKNYDFIQDLWSQKLANETLLEIAIQKCIKSNIFDYIVVASDEQEVKKVLSKYSDKRLRFEKREKIDTLRSVKPVEAFKDIIEKYDKNFSGVVTFSYIHAPFVTTSTLEEAVNTLYIHDSDTSFGVEMIDESIYKQDGDHMRLLNDKIADSVEPLYKDANIAFATKSLNIQRGSFYNCNIVNFVVSHDENMVINSELSLEISDLKYKKMLND